MEFNPVVDFFIKYSASKTKRVICHEDTKTLSFTKLNLLNFFTFPVKRNVPCVTLWLCGRMNLFFLKMPESAAELKREETNGRWVK